MIFRYTFSTPVSKVNLAFPEMGLSDKFIGNKCEAQRGARRGL